METILKEIRGKRTGHSINLNSFAPEILSEIFTCLNNAHRNPSPRSRSVDRDRMSSLLAITGVRKYWRNLALACKSLWAEVIFITPAFAELMLERARNAPLTIEFVDPPGAFEDIFLRIISQAAQLRVVYLRGMGGPTNLATKLLSAICDSAPILERLTLDGWPGSSSNRVPEYFVNRKIPSLKYLEINRYHTNIVAAIDPGILGANLTHLKYRPGLFSTRPTSPRALRDFLAKIPRLHTLFISHSLPVDPYFGDPLVMRNLRSLYVEDAEALVAYSFCAAVQFPHVDQLEFKFTGGTGDFDKVFMRLATCWRGRLLPPPGTFLKMTSKSEPHFTFTNDEPTSGSTTLSFTLSGYYRPADTIIEDIKQYLAFPTIHRLEIEGTWVAQIKHSWSNVFARLPNLHTITFIDKAPGPEFTAALTGGTRQISSWNLILSPETSKASSNANWAFPALTTITYIERADIVASLTNRAAALALVAACEDRPAACPPILLVLKRALSSPSMHGDSPRDRTPTTTMVHKRGKCIDYDTGILGPSLNPLRPRGTMDPPPPPSKWTLPLMPFNPMIFFAQNNSNVPSNPNGALAAALRFRSPIEPASVDDVDDYDL